MGALLYDEPPIAVSPTLCRRLGLPEAVFLQQLHYRLQLKASDPKTYDKYRVDDRHWVYWTQTQLLVEVPLGRTTDPHKRVIRRLRDIGVLLVRQLRAAEWDHTNHFSIDYQALDSLIQSPNSGNASIGGIATDRWVAAPPIDSGESHPSTGGVATVHSTKMSTEKFTKTTTTECVLDLHPISEEYRVLIEHAVRELPTPLAQHVADEIAGVMVAAEKGQRAPLREIQSWIASVADKARHGTFCYQYGKQIASARKMRLRALQKADDQKESDAVTQVTHNVRRRATEHFLSVASDDQLNTLAALASQHAGIPSPQRQREARDRILRRTLPTRRIEQSVVETLVAAVFANPDYEVG